MYDIKRNDERQQPFSQNIWDQIFQENFKGSLLWLEYR